MNALEAASLVMIPSGYEDGTLGSLKPTDGTGDFTFSRGSNISATRVNADGYIEKGYENLLLQSNSFTTTWVSFGVTPTSGETGYDGSNDAWSLTKNSGTFRRLYQSVSTSGVVCFSVYAKAKDSSVFQLAEYGTNNFVTFDLSDTPSSSDRVVSKGSTIITTSFSDVGNGWYRFSIIFNKSGSWNAVIYAGNPSDSNLTSIYIQDAMLNQGLVAYPYVETTTAPVAGGILEDMPRLDYSNGSCPSLLLEPSRTNLVPSSEYLSSIPWNSNTLTFSWDTSLLNLEGYYGVQEITGVGSAVYNNMASAVNIGDKLCYSIWAKSSSNANFKFGGLYGGEHATFDVSTGTLVAQGARLDSYEVVDYGNGWRRYVIVINYSGAGGNKAYGHIEWNDASEPIYLYGLQLEQDATYPTSYIPTYGVSQTRLAETMEQATSSFDITGDYTFFFEVSRIEGYNSGNSLFIALNNTTDADIIFLYNVANDKNIRFLIREGATGGDNIYSPINSFEIGERVKFCIRKDSTKLEVFFNGSSIGSTTNHKPDGFNNFLNGFKLITMHQNLVFPTALSDEACIELTTI